MSTALAWFLTWSCYGARLHGDERGSVDDEHNLIGHPRIVADRVRENVMKARMSQPPFLLSADARRVVEQAIREHCDVRHLRLLAIYCGSNHVHVVLSTAQSETPEGVMQRFKMWSTRALINVGHVGRGRRVWTDHGSTLWLNSPEQLANKVDYVSRLQTHPGRFE